MDTDALVEAACAEVVQHTQDRTTVLIFASGIRHGEHVARVLRERHGVECGFIEGGTPARERHRQLKRFRIGELKYLANVNVLTTGFDATNIDCIAMLRPTLSPGLYYQMVGRGFRTHPGKADCLVLDFGGNILRHGPVDQIRIDPPAAGAGEAPAKECPECHALIAAGYAACPECGYEFPPPQRQRHDATASDESILSDQTSSWHQTVSDVSYHVHYKRDDPAGTAPPSMRVEYQCGLRACYREWVCFEHTGYARQKAERWWLARSREPVPATVEEAVDLASAGALAPALAITVRKKAGDEYERVVGYELGDKPPRLESNDDLPDPAEPVGAAYGIDPEDIPF
jgi:DNA repair protein RadD